MYLLIRLLNKNNSILFLSILERNKRTFLYAHEASGFSFLACINAMFALIFQQVCAFLFGKQVDKKRAKGNRTELIHRTESVGLVDGNEREGTGDPRRVRWEHW